MTRHPIIMKCYCTSPETEKKKREREREGEAPNVALLSLFGRKKQKGSKDQDKIWLETVKR